MFKRGLSILVVVVAASLGLPAALAQASGANNTFVLSGQDKGTLTLNSTETGASGNIDTSDGETTVRVYLSDHDIKPTKDAWYFIFETESKTLHFPSSLPSLIVGATNGPSIAYEWSRGDGLGHGDLRQRL
jgi:hypothetical protein